METMNYDARNAHGKLCKIDELSCKSNAATFVRLLVLVRRPAVERPATGDRRRGLPGVLADRGRQELAAVRLGDRLQLQSVGTSRGRHVGGRARGAEGGPPGRLAVAALVAAVATD